VTHKKKKAKHEYYSKIISEKKTQHKTSMEDN